MIVKSPNVCGGAARIKGSRIRVVDIVREYCILGYSKREIAEKYRLTIEDVKEALTYYIHNREEVNKILKKEEKVILELLNLRKI